MKGIYSAWLALLIVQRTSFVSAAETNSPAVLKYEEPRFLTATISDRSRKHVLFTFTRKAYRSGSSLDVIRDYNYPDGRLAARERVHYEGDALVSFQLDEFQTGEQGSAVISLVPKKSAEKEIFFQWSKDEKSKNKPQTGHEALRKDVLISDMVGPFLLSHWDELMKGNEVKCRYIVLTRKETVGFTFSKQREGISAGKAVVVLKMEPTSPIIAELVDPLFFTIEKEGSHHVLEYSGRTTPKIKVGNKWKDLDAVTVFDWNGAR